MRAVSRFEANLLRILQALLHRAPVSPVLPLVLAASPRPACLRRAAVELVQDTLAKGCVLRLAELGGWRRERHLCGERVVEGRLWERTPPAELALKFSRHALDFLIWLTAASLESPKTPPWQPPEAELTPADQLLVFLAFDALAADRVILPLQRQPALQRNALCRLAYPDKFAGAPADALPDFVPWTAGLGACILEVLQTHLIERWLDMEWKKGQIEKWPTMQALGRSQERTLGPFLQAAAQAGRWDLARFVLRAAAGVLTEDARPEHWVGNLRDAGPRLADRSATYRAALALLHQLPRLQEWTRQARGVGYFDEGYAGSQLWKADWERWQGDALCERAGRLIQQLDPMRQT
jgi:hypothetical protein